MILAFALFAEEKHVAAMTSQSVNDACGNCAIAIHVTAPEIVALALFGNELLAHQTGYWIVTETESIPFLSMTGRKHNCTHYFLR